MHHNVTAYLCHCPSTATRVGVTFLQSARFSRCSSRARTDPSPSPQLRSAPASSPKGGCWGERGSGYGSSRRCCSVSWCPPSQHPCFSVTLPPPCVTARRDRERAREGERARARERERDGEREEERAGMGGRARLLPSLAAALRAGWFTTGLIRPCSLRRTQLA